MAVHGTPAWCRGCEDWVLAEELRQPEEIEAAVRRFYEQRRNGGPDLPYDIQSKASQDAMNERMLQASLREAAQWRQALRRRTSPPRCLDCGSCDFVRLPKNNEWMPHPLDSGRRVRIRPRSEFVAMEGGVNVYDIEGNRISRQREDS
jgi:hypothetical protein